MYDIGCMMFDFCSVELVLVENRFLANYSLFFLMFEQLSIGLLFLGAVSYIGNRLWKELSRKKSGCGKNCGCDEK